MITFPFTLMASGSATPAAPEAQFYESFSGYTLGNLRGQVANAPGEAGGLWLHPTNGTTGIQVDATGLTYGNLRTHPQAGARSSSSEDRIFADLTTEVRDIMCPAGVGTKTWFVSCLFQSPVAATDKRFAIGFGKYDASRSAPYRLDETLAIWLSAGPSASSFQTQLKDSNNNSSGLLVHAMNEPALFVVRFDVTWDGGKYLWEGRLKKYTGGTIPTAEPSVWDIQTSAPKQWYNQFTQSDRLYRFFVRGEWSTSDPGFKVDEVRLSDDFARVVPVGE